MLEPNQPTFEIALTHFIVSDDVERSRRSYTEVLGGKTVRTGEPSFGALANSWIIINVGGGPTNDKPTVTLETARDPDRDQQLPQHPGLGHPSCVQRVERARRGVPHTTETARDGRSAATCATPMGHLIEVGQTTLAGNWHQFLIDS